MSEHRRGTLAVEGPTITVLVLDLKHRSALLQFPRRQQHKARGTYKEREGLLEVGHLFLRQRIGLVTVSMFTSLHSAKRCPTILGSPNWWILEGFWMIVTFSSPSSVGIVVVVKDQSRGGRLDAVNDVRGLPVGYSASIEGKRGTRGHGSVG